MKHDTQNTQKCGEATTENSLAVPQNVEKFRLQVFVPRELDVRVEIAAAQRQVTKSQLVEDAIRAYLNIDTAAA